MIGAAQVVLVGEGAGAQRRIARRERDLDQRDRRLLHRRRSVRGKEAWLFSASVRRRVFLCHSHILLSIFWAPCSARTRRPARSACAGSQSGPSRQTLLVGSMTYLGESLQGELSI